MSRFSSAGLLFMAAVADVPVMPDQYSLLCEGEQATGFNWVGGQWVKANFRADRYIVVRSPENECLFGAKLDTVLRGEDFFFSREACLNIREIGKEFNPKLSEKCTEYYVLIEKKWVKQFSCDGLLYDFEGNFDGGFRRISESSVNDDIPRKDSMVLEVGKCSRIS